MSWSYRIAILYLSFVGLIVFMVTKTFSFKVDLVDKNYYEKELKYQEVIDAKQNFKELGTCSILQNTDSITFLFSKNFIAKNTNGNIYFHSLANSDNDAQYALAIDSLGEQKIKKNNLKKGYYKVEVDFVADNKRFFYEQNYTITKK